MSETDGKTAGDIGVEITEAHLRALGEVVPDGLFVAQDGAVVFANDSFARLLGTTAAALDGLDLGELLHPSHQTELAEPFRRAVADAQSARVVFPFRHHQLSVEVTVHLQAIPIEYGGRSAHLVAVRAIEEGPEQAEVRYRELVDKLPSAVFEADLEGCFTLVNRAATAMFGYRDEELVTGLRCFDTIAPSDRQRAMHNFQRALRRGQHTNLTQYLAQRQDGATFPALIYSESIIEDGKPIGVRGCVLDLSEQQLTEAGLQHSQRLEVLSMLAGGIARDVNNLLMGIQGRISLVGADLTHDHPHTTHLEGMEDCVQRAAALMRELLSMTRAQPYRVEPLDLNEITERMVELITRTHDHLQVRCTLAPGLQPTRADRVQLEQVLLHLLLHAAVATPTKREVSVRTETVTLEQEFVAAHGASPGAFLKLTIVDPAEAPTDRLKDIGMLSVAGSVQGGGGIVVMRHEPAPGRTYELFLPALAEPAASKAPVSGRLATGTGTVLIVDDEVGVLSTSTRLLQMLGYTPLSASTGERALELCREHDVDLVILDLIMPRPAGLELLEELRQVRPDLKVLLTSGLIPDQRTQELIAAGHEFMQKPFRFQTLANKMRQLLGE